MDSDMSPDGIVVGIDGSLEATAAARWAAREAALREVSLTLIHVIANSLSSWPAMGWPTAALPPGFGRHEMDQGRKVIKDTLEVIAKTTDRRRMPEITASLCVPPAVPTLLEFAERAQMIVVGRRGQGALRRALLGSVSSAMLHHARCPVAVIHHRTPARVQLGQAPVLVGIDGSPKSELATAIAFDEASRRAVDLIALHARSAVDGTPFPAMRWTAPQVAAEEVLAERLSGWQERYPDVNVERIVSDNHPAQSLLEEAERAQLVVVGSRGRGGFTGMLLGSVSAVVVQASRTPTIVATQPLDVWKRDGRKRYRIDARRTA
jgi:nucleotide-binding universal stress UspA family protein